MSASATMSNSAFRASTAGWSTTDTAASCAERLATVVTRMRWLAAALAASQACCCCRVASRPVTPATSRPPAAGAPKSRSARGFDFYVLSLSWSPSYCEAEGDDANPAAMQGGAALRLRRAWPVAAIRARLSRGLPDQRAAGPQRNAAHALRPDAVGRADPPRMDLARRLHRPVAGRLFRGAARGPREDRDSRAVPPDRRLSDSRPTTMPKRPS